MEFWFNVSLLLTGPVFFIGVLWVLITRLKTVERDFVDLRQKSNELLSYTINLRAVAERIAKKTDELHIEAEPIPDEDGFQPGIYDPEEQLYPWDEPGRSPVKESK